MKILLTLLLFATPSLFAQQGAGRPALNRTRRYRTRPATRQSTERHRARFRRQRGHRGER